MQILKNSSIAVGIEWTLHESLTQAKKAAAGKKKILVARKVISGECVQGIYKSSRKTGKLQAGALLAAAVASDVLIYHSLGDGNAWLCAVREGIPLHGFDLVAEEESAKVTLAEVMSYVPTADIYGDVPGAKGTLEELLVHLTPKDRKAAELKVPDSPVFTLVLVGIILLLAAIALFGYPLFNKAMDGYQASAAQQRKAEELRQIKIAFDAEVAQQKDVFWHAASPTQQFQDWYAVLRTLPVSVEGWTPSSFNCDVNACLVSWKRDFRALPSATVHLPGEGSAQAFNPALQEVSTRFPIKTLALSSHAQGIAEPDKYLLDLAINPTPFLLNLPPTQTPVTVTPPPGVEGLMPVTLGREGQWRLSGANPLLLPQYLGKLELPGVVLNKISIKSLNLGRPQYLIELEGRYRVGN